LNQRDIRRLKAAEMKFMRRTAGYSLLDHRRNEDILEELRVDPVKKKLAQCKQKCLNHVSRMEDIRYPKEIPDYRPVGRRLGRPLNRPQDEYNREAETGHFLAKLCVQKKKKKHGVIT
jgi:hypothetical protein